MRYSQVETLCKRTGHHASHTNFLTISFLAPCILPCSDKALATIQNFNIAVSKAPVDAEIICRRGGRTTLHVVAKEKVDAVLLVRRRQKDLPAITQTFVNYVRQFLVEDLLATYIY